MDDWWCPPGFGQHLVNMDPGDSKISEWQDRDDVIDGGRVIGTSSKVRSSIDSEREPGKSMAIDRSGQTGGHRRARAVQAVQAVQVKPRVRRRADAEDGSIMGEDVSPTVVPHCSFNSFQFHLI